MAKHWISMLTEATKLYMLLQKQEFLVEAHFILANL